MPRISLVLVLLLFLFPATAQETEPTVEFIDTQYFYGTLIRHNLGVAHLVKAHPAGFMVAYNRKTFGEKLWHSEYNYPDWGLSFVYQDFRYDVLGQNFGLYGHLNFYFLKRHLRFRLAQGIAYNTNPFDLLSNSKNTAYGSHLLATTCLALTYSEENVIDRLGVEAGVHLLHHSNGSVKSPNSGTNVLFFGLGLQYQLNSDAEPAHKHEDYEENRFRERLKYNVVLRGGVNESDYVNLGQSAFWVVSGYVDKRFSYKHTFQLGAEVFFSNFLKKEIEYVAVSFPGRNLDTETDYKRIGVFAGHEFRIGKLAVVSQLGYYVYYPYRFESRVYTRLGLKYYLNDRWFGEVAVKAHAANAESIAYGFGIRL